MYNFARWCVGVILCIIMLSLQFDGKVQIGRVGGKYAWRLASSRPVQGSKRAPWCATFFEMRAGYNSFSKLSCQVGSAIPVWCIIMNNARSSSATSKIIEGVLHVASCQLPRIAEVIIPSTPTPSQDSYVQKTVALNDPTNFIDLSPKYLWCGVCAKNSKYHKKICLLHLDPTSWNSSIYKPAVHFTDCAFWMFKTFQ